MNGHSSDCGCCAGVAVQTPMVVYNRGLMRWSLGGGK